MADADASSVPDTEGLAHERRFAEQSAAMVMLPIELYRAALAAATPKTVSAEVLVLNIRALTAAARVEDAEATLAKLVECRPTPDAEPGAGRGLRDWRYTYLEGMRFQAMKLVPKRQGQQLDEDLFQDALVEVMKTLHTNVSAVRYWKSFCFGRLLDVRRHTWGTDLAKLGVEVAESNRSEGEREAYEEAERAISDAEQDAEAGKAANWDWFCQFARALFRDADPVLQAVVEDQWLPPAEASSLRSLAAKLDVQYDRLYNIHLEAQTRLVAALMAQTKRPPVDHEMLKQILLALPAKRGSKKKGAPRKKKGPPHGTTGEDVAPDTSE